MTSKLLIILTTCVFLNLVCASDADRIENAESYITKEAAKELRNKLSHIKNDGNVEEQQDDYDEILKEIIQSQGLKKQHNRQQKQQPSVFYEKKYFDYLPNEISDSDDVTSEDSSHELVKKQSEYNTSEDEQQHMMNNDAINADDDDDGDNKKKQHRASSVSSESKHRIVRRDVQQQDDENRTRHKRQNVYYVPLNHYNPHPRVHFFYPSHDPFFSDIFNSIASESQNPSYATAAIHPMPQQSQFGYNPWTPQNNPHMKFHAPYNFYLPPVTQPSQTYLPVGPTNQPPINVPLPPDNKQGSQQGGNNEEIDDRVGGFESEDNTPVWGSQSFVPKGEANRGGGSAARPTQRTPPPFIKPIHQHHQNSRPNAIDEYDKIFSPNEKQPQPEYEIEYAPEIQEDVTSTTRASIRNPNRRKEQQNRQKKEEYQTTTQPTRTTTLQYVDNINSLYSQQVNSRKPKKALPACVEAIVNCCSKYDDVVRVPCFEAHNCKGAFFGQSPCSYNIKQAAFREVEKYAV